MLENARLRSLVQTFWSPGVLNLGAVFCCIGLIIASHVFEVIFGEDPCPLCLFQRYFVVWVGLFFALAVTLRYVPQGGRPMWLGASVVSLIFAFLALPETAAFIPLDLFLRLINRTPVFLRYLCFITFVFYAAIYLLGFSRWLSVKTLFRLTAIALLIAAIFGAGTSIRHIWIQTLPDGLVPACTPPLDFMVEIQGVWGAIEQTFLVGSGDCHDSSWRFLFLTMPMWVLIWFVGLGVFGFVRNGIYPQEK